MAKENEIQLVTKPEIKHHLQEAGAKVTERLAELNIENMIATLETVKSLKELRAELNKELDAYEQQRKFIKNAILAPYNEFDGVYKDEISEKYSKAIVTLKDKIDMVETSIKDDKRDKVVAYFKELCALERIDFIAFESVGLEINLSTTEKAYKEKCHTFVDKVKDDLALIKTMDAEAEILTEYKKSLNASQAITSVHSRKEAEAAETERLRQIETATRVRRLTEIGLQRDEFTGTYAYSAEVFISEKDIKEMSKDDFQARFIALELAITGDQPQANATAAPLQAPQEVKKEATVTASFEVSGTMSQIKALGQYMKENNITYKNI